jgi:hypothetical protein
MRRAPGALTRKLPAKVIGGSGDIILNVELAASAVRDLQNEFCIVSP